MRRSSICVNLCKKKTQLTNINFERKILDFFLILELKWIHLLSYFITLFLQTRLFERHFQISFWFSNCCFVVFCTRECGKEKEQCLQIVYHIKFCKTIFWVWFECRCWCGFVDLLYKGVCFRVGKLSFADLCLLYFPQFFLNTSNRNAKYRFSNKEDTITELGATTKVR